MSQKEVTISMSGREFTGIAGLPISRRAVRILRDRGIYAHSHLSVEHQELAKRYVIRGLESGGAAGDVGRYVTVAAEDGQPLECLHPVETIAVNGLHAVVLSKAMLRADMLRKGRTYDLLITRHWLSFASDGRAEVGMRDCLPGGWKWTSTGRTSPTGVASCRRFTRWPARRA